jgi:asparagine synthase (glutamine-hydrolysing)
MCGICGEIRFDNVSPSIISIQRMVDSLAPRGPDGSGIVQMNHLSMGHRRLKIIDLSEQAQQPMIDNDLGLGIVYNGAIYNYPQLRDELIALGYRFFSHGDTEVILKAYHAWGESCVEKLSGMFAFAVWERDSGRLFLARDRLGIKPLYYTEHSTYFRFASTLPALLTGEGIDKDIDPVALHHYMSFHSVVPAPYTILKGVRKLPPATTLVIETDGQRRQRLYWKPSFESRTEDASLSFEDWKEHVLEGLRLAVKRRLVADVPVGVLLSGGLDSSLIVSLLAELGQQGLNTFSVGFESVDDEPGDEFPYSDLIAKHFGTEHHKLFVDSGVLLPSLRDCVKAMSEPMVSHDVIGFYLLSETVSRHVKVVQSGQGADEVFAGYHWYPPLMASQRAAADYAHVFFDRDHEEFATAVHPRWVGEDHSTLFLNQHFAQPGASSAINKALRLDTSIMLVDDPVKRVDNMSMAWGLEARVPFLDHDLVELAARIPPRYKVAHGGKYVLKEVARKLIPWQVIDRPKGYFPVPVLKYLEGDSLDFVRKVLADPRARDRELFRQDYVQSLLAAPKDHITPLRGSKLWQLSLLEYWLQTQGL